MKIVAIVFLVYVGIVATFESLLGYFQPQGGGRAMVITTYDEDGTGHDRVVSRLETDGKLYVAVNHWPRAWYRRVLRNPDLQVTRDGETGDYRAVPTGDAEYERVNSEHRRGLVFLFLTGFPPRHILRLDPR